MTGNPIPTTSFLRTETRKTADEVTICCSGQFTLKSCEQIQKTVRGLVPASKRVVLDFAQVNYIEKAALGSIVGLYLSSKHLGCQLNVHNMPPWAIDLLSRWPEDAFETGKSIPARPQALRTNT
ncbi:MAG TPA: STAS domain-containing protein [Terriglobales bacterium]|nr:STAS domain-containing protein [Terriglobales bacterium]